MVTVTQMKFIFKKYSPFSKKAFVHFCGGVFCSICNESTIQNHLCRIWFMITLVFLLAFFQINRHLANNMGNPSGNCTSPSQASRIRRSSQVCWSNLPRIIHLWWLNQPIWEILSRQIEFIFPSLTGENSKNVWKKPPRISSIYLGDFRIDSVIPKIFRFTRMTAATPHPPHTCPSFPRNIWQGYSIQHPSCPIWKGEDLLLPGNLT